MSMDQNQIDALGAQIALSATLGMKKLTRDETEHGQHYYLASEVDAALAQPVQPVQPVQEPFGHWHWEQPMIKPLQGRFVKGPSDGKLNGVPGIPLHTRSFATQPAQPENQPLTEEQATELLPAYTGNMTRAEMMLWVLRATERAHGITAPAVQRTHADDTEGGTHD